MMFKFNNGEVPKPISDLFVLNRFFHNHNILETLVIFRLHFVEGQLAIVHLAISAVGIHIWNHMSQDVSINVRKSAPPPPPLHVQTKVLYFNSHTNVML